METDVKEVTFVQAITTLDDHAERLRIVVPAVSTEMSTACDSGWELRDEEGGLVARVVRDNDGDLTIE